jgi:aspartate racemase
VGSSKQLAKVRNIVNNLICEGAEAIVLGCTEMLLIVKQEHYSMPIIDSTRVHAEYALRYALNYTELQA